MLHLQIWFSGSPFVSWGNLPECFAPFSFLLRTIFLSALTPTPVHHCFPWKKQSLGWLVLFSICFMTSTVCLSTPPYNVVGDGLEEFCVVGEGLTFFPC